jgi:hypothetical protein
VIKKTMSKTSSLISIDFRVDNIPPTLFNNGLGAQDGTIFGSPDGAVLSSWRFTQTAKPHHIDSWLDSFKLFTFLSNPVIVANHQITKFEADIATRQVFMCEKPIPECLYKRVNDIYADFRLGSSGLSIIDPDTGLWYAILGTDHQLWAVYGRLPIYRVNWPSCVRSIFQAIGVQPYSCNPCVPNPWVPVLPRCAPWYDVNKCEYESRRALEQCVKKNRFDKTNFLNDENYLQWKKCLNVRRVNGWNKYLAWTENAKANKVTVYDWVAYVEFEKGYKPIDATAADIEANKANLSYENYTSWVIFNCWKRLKKQYLALQADPCNPEPLRECSTDTASESSILPCEPKIYYEFCADCTDCCEYAAFLHATPLIRREQCNPQVDFDRVAIHYHAENNTVHYLVNGIDVPSALVVKPGHRMGANQVIDYGGYAETIVSQRFLVGFGNFTFLDAALPGSAKLNCGYRQQSALAQLLPDDHYYQTAFNKHGELEAVVPAEAFGITDCKPEHRIFGQGTVLIIRNLNVCQTCESNCSPLFVPVNQLCCAKDCVSSCDTDTISSSACGCIGELV